jgi:hypothetical protein
LHLAGRANVILASLALNRAGSTSIRCLKVVSDCTFSADRITIARRTAIENTHAEGTRSSVGVVSVRALQAQGLGTGVTVWQGCIAGDAGSRAQIVSNLAGKAGADTTSLTAQSRTRKTVIGSKGGVEVEASVATGTHGSCRAFRTILLAFTASGSREVISHTAAETRSRIASTTGDGAKRTVAS